MRKKEKETPNDASLGFGIRASQTNEVKSKKQLKKRSMKRIMKLGLNEQYIVSNKGLILRKKLTR